MIEMVHDKKLMGPSNSKLKNYMTHKPTGLTAAAFHWNSENSRETNVVKIDLQLKVNVMPLGSQNWQGRNREKLKSNSSYSLKTKYRNEWEW